MALAWQEPDLVSPEDEVWCNQDPAEMVASLALLAELAPAPSWWSDAACRGMGCEPWFPSAGQSTEPARAVCASCEVVEECLAAVADEPDFLSYGIWGGLSARQRRLVRRSAA